MLVSGPAFAADDAGEFAIKGAGVLTCRVFLNERDLQSNVYYMIGGWLDGYLTSLNKHTEDTYDITSFESSELLAEVIFGHCTQHPDDVLYSVLNSIVINLAPDKLHEKSPMVLVRVGDREGRLYELVLQRMHRELKRRGLLDEDAAAGMNDETIAAIRRFQSSIAFEPTGYPDQATLWRLLRRE